jgi:NADH-quinone oxidoreductase subunit E
MINWEFFDNQTPESARDLVDALRRGERLTPTRGLPLCTFRHSERILAGFPDDRPDNGQGGAGAATLAGLHVARDHEMQAPPGPDRGATSVGSSSTAEAGRADAENH